MKKQNKNKRHYRRVYDLGVHLWTPFFYIYSLPSLILHTIKWRIDGYPLDIYLRRLSDINNIRREVCFACKKQTATESEKVKFAYYFNDRFIGIHIRFYRKALEKDYENFIFGCSLATGLNTSALIKKRGYYSFILFDNVEPMQKIICDRKKISIGTGYAELYYWDYSIYPHALIVGPTGTGKTNLLRVIIEGLYKKKYEIWCVDGKNGLDLGLETDKFKRYLPLSKVNETTYIAFLEELYSLMDDRAEILKKHGVRKYTETDDMDPMFVIIEENSAIMDSLDKKTQDKVSAILSNIVRLSRAVGMELIFSLQRPDTKYVVGELRSNLSLRVVCGKAESACYKMAFDDTDVEPLKLGKVWCQQGADREVLSVINMDEYKD